jgi:hypothetical protein
LLDDERYMGLVRSYFDGIAKDIMPARLSAAGPSQGVGDRS